MRFVQFSYYKTVNRTALCDVVRCGAVILFCEQFWCGFYDLCGLCGLVNTPSSNLPFGGYSVGTTPMLSARSSFFIVQALFRVCKYHVAHW